MLARIKSLGIPPTHTDARVCRSEDGYLQATGHDAKSRKQYRYHPHWCATQNEHVEVEGATLHFHFVGKSGEEHTIDVRDRRLTRVVQRLRDLPGQEVFQYTDDDGARHTIDSADVNDYLHEITGEHFTAKDFQT